MMTGPALPLTGAPPPFDADLAEARRDLSALDALRGRSAHLRQLLGRVEDSEMALGSDVMGAALEGYALLKVMGKGAGLEALRRDISARFSYSTAAGKREAAPAQPDAAPVKP